MTRHQLQQALWMQRKAGFQVLININEATEQEMLDEMRRIRILLVDRITKRPSFEEQEAKNVNLDWLDD